jgi:hypothetical protein
LEAEPDSPWFEWRAFGVGYVRLKFYSVSTCFGYSVNERVSHTKATIMGLRYLTNNETRMALADYTGA